MKTRSVSFHRSVKCMVAFVMFAGGCMLGWPQQVSQSNPDADLAQSIRELREQVQDLRSAVSEIRSEAAQYRAENEQLRKELENIRANPQQGKATEAPNTSAQAASQAPAIERRVASLEETSQLQQSELRTLYQTKVESASKYRVRLSGLVLLNLFHNGGGVDNQDVPTYASAPGIYGATSTFGATMRQSELGLEVFGPQLAGAKTSGHVQMDFGGGFPVAALDGVNTGIVRLRTANMRLDWENTSVVIGQDGLFISPNSPTSFASLLVPSLGYSGNLWAWTPQVRVEHRFSVGENQSISVAGGILDNITGEPSYGSRRGPEAGESSAQPAYALRTAWTEMINGRPLTIGASGYYSRQNWGYGWTVDGWAGATDWRVPVSNKFELSGEFYRGRAVGGLGGGIGQSVLYGGTPTNANSPFEPLNSAGGWAQLKFSATPHLEFNGAFGTDNPFAADVHAFPAPVGIYSTVLSANRSAMMNFIYRPRSDLLFSGEYRHLRTTEIDNFYGANHVNLMMGVLF